MDLASNSGVDDRNRRFFFFVFGVAAPSACNVDTIAKANANVTKNRTANPICSLSTAPVADMRAENPYFVPIKRVCGSFLKLFLLMEQAR